MIKMAGNFCYKDFAAATLAASFCYMLDFVAATLVGSAYIVGGWGLAHSL